MLIPLMSGSAINAVFTFEVIMVSSIFLPTVVSDESAVPGLPAAPVADEPVVVDGLVEELAVLDGLVEELALLDGLVDGLVEELELLDGLVVVPGLVVESAVLAGLFASLRAVLSLPASHALSVKAIAEAITVLVKMFMIVFLFENNPQKSECSTQAARKHHANALIARDRDGARISVVEPRHFVNRETA